MKLLIKRGTLLSNKVFKHLDLQLSRPYIPHMMWVHSRLQAVEVFWSYCGDTDDCKVGHSEFISVLQLQETWQPKRKRK